MFSSGPNYTKLKTHLRLSVNRLKLLEKKKTELAQKSRKEIADYLAAGKVERAKIRVEHIIREDYLVEAMEIVEMYCDLLLARFGLLTQMKELDSGIAEQVSSLIWVAPRLQADVAELKVIAELLTSKYGKPFAESCRTASGEHYVSEKLMHKLAVQAPPKLLVEKYLIEIAKIYNIDYEPDAQIMKEAAPPAAGGMLIDLSAPGNNLGGSGGSGGGGGGFAVPQPAGFIGYPQAPQLPPMPMLPNSAGPFSYPAAASCGPAPVPFGAGSMGSPSAPPALNYNILPNAGDDSLGGANGGGSGSGGNEKKDLNINTTFLREETNAAPPPAYTATVSPDDNLHPRIVPQPSAPPPSYSAAVNSAQQQNLNKPKPQPRSKMPTSSAADADDGFPNLPSVPSDLPDLPDVPGSHSGSVRPNNDDEIDFDDLARRFEELTKKK